MSWQELNLPLELIRLCTELVTKIPSKLTYEHWNFILISLALWEVSMIKSKQHSNDFKVCVQFRNVKTDCLFTKSNDPLILLTSLY